MLAEWRQSTRLPVGAIGAKMRLGLNKEEEEKEAPKGSARLVT